MNKKIPQNVKFIICTLESHGYEAYLVGGCVRDMLLSRMPNDYDVTTNAEPAVVERIFNNARSSSTSQNISLTNYGKQHGTIAVVIDGVCYEITTYRVDGEYSDNRRPDSVVFTRNLTDDLARRDYTINAMAMDKSGNLIDPFGGQSDLEHRIIRAVGDPDKRFQEDSLRILRGVRFAAQLGFDIEDETAAALYNNRELLNNISAERIQTELNKTLLSRECTRIMRKYRDIFATVIPELSEMFDFDQNNPYHCYDVWEHTLHAVDACSTTDEHALTLRLSALLHDIGKPRCYVEKDDWGHFYGHEGISADMAGQILKRLKYDKQTTHDVVSLIKAHSIVFNLSEKHARRKLNQLGERILHMLIDLERADVAAQNYSVREPRIQAIDEYEMIVLEVLRQEQCFKVKDLAVTGADLIAQGVPQGPEIGKILDKLLELVINGDVANERELLLAEVGLL